MNSVSARNSNELSKYRTKLSSISIRGMNAHSSGTISKAPHRNLRWRSTMKLDIRTIRRCSKSSDLRCGKGSSDSSAGMNVTVSTAPNREPTATMFPSSDSGGESLKLSDRKPTMVVSVLIRVGISCTRMAIATARSRSPTRACCWITVVTKCTQSAKNSVMITAGAEPLALLRTAPNQP